jgi:hypothetical protein
MVGFQLLLPVRSRARFYRPAASAEVDLVVEFGANRISAFEIKLSSARLSTGAFTMVVTMLQ